MNKKNLEIIKNKYLQKINKIAKKIKKFDNSIKQIIIKNNYLYLIGNDLKNKSYGNFKKEAKNKFLKDLTEKDMYEPTNLHQKIKKIIK